MSESFGTNAPAIDATDLPAIGHLMPFAGLLGVTATDAHENGLTATLPWRDDLCTAGGILHGGTLMSFADAVGAAAAFVRLPPGTTTTTVSSSTSFLAPIRSGTATARAYIEHAGRRFITVRTEIRDDTGRLASVTVQTQAVL